MKIDYDTRVTRIDGTEADLSGYRGKVLLIVNTASKCGFTPQFDGLQKLHERFGEQGLSVLGFPCNQFAGQDPGDNENIDSFCRVNYGVSFPMHAKIEVNGGNTHPLYQQLKNAQKGLLGSSAVKWNFTKFLVDANGEIVARFGPQTKPEKIAARIEALLQAGAQAEAQSEA